ncbi:hypothetical protein [Rubellicoccus peritrichatus]|uniref:Uncharacterized protein n=1 Tax=Rubellicoccus peritrichatus TaxID=3080537 RepID=A0AAQ3L8P5_9BACT|nr:hypothetical protein [Puniceicoccus sp. CR14]WOO39340.1 hypothetical protein RZN69_12010 [Puniceicoccus sp. CR14]
MKRPSLVQVLAVVNSILVVVMMVEIYRLKNPKPNAPVQLQPTPLAATSERPETDELLNIIITQGTAKEKLKAINQLPDQLEPKQQDQLFVWATETLPESNEHNRLEILDLSDTAYRKLITAEYAPAKLASYFEQAANNKDLWLPLRQQALIGIFLLFEQVAKDGTDPDKKAVLDALKQATKATLHEDSHSLPITAIDGGVFLETRVTQNPIQNQLDEYCLAILQTEHPRTITLKAIDYAKVRGLDISSQAAHLIKSSQDAAVAIAAQNFLLNFQKTQAEQQQP